MNTNPFFLRKTYVDWVTVWGMLVLLTLPSAGLTVAASQSLSGSQRNGGTEEVEERAPCSVQRRIQVDCALDGTATFGKSPACASPKPIVSQLQAEVAGHRLSNGLLAPMRC